MPKTDRPPFKEEHVRFSANIPKTLNRRLNKYLQWGTKGEVVRQLLYLLDELVTHGDRGLYSVVDLLDDKLKLASKNKPSD